MHANHTLQQMTFRALPLFILVAALALFAIGWAVENEVKISSTTLSNVLNSETQPSAEVVVVPNSNQAPVAPKVLPAPPVVIPVAPSSNSVQLPAPANSQISGVSGVSGVSAAGEAPAVAAAPVVTVTATLQPTLPPVTATSVVIESGEENVSGHCSEWTNENCVVQPTATTAPTYQPPVVAEPTATPLPPTPTITPTPLPERNSISSIVTLQGAKNHGNTSIIVTNSSGVATHTITNEGGLFQVGGLDKGTYQLAAYSANGSHLPSCATITVAGNESIAIPQTMLRAVNLSASGGSLNTDETVNIGAAALVAIQFGLTIPEHLVPILDVTRDGIVNETDANALIANPRLLACQAW